MKKLFFLIPAVILFQNSICYSQKDSVNHFLDSVNIKDKHPEDSPPNSGFTITSKDGKSFLKVIGSVRVNGAYDFNGLQSKQTFSTYDIPVGDDNINEPRFFIGAYQTRFGVEILKETSLGNIFLKVEADFLGTDNSFRLRDGYGVIKNFLLGKAWSVFGDPESIPKTVDKDGPNSSVSERAIEIRFEPPQQNSLRYAFALETPSPNISNPDTIVINNFFQSFPDVTSRLRYESKSWGHIQLAGVLRSITIRDINQELQALAGYGGLFSGKIGFSKKNNLYFQFVGGKGISSYIESLSGEDLDVVFDYEENVYQLLPVYGGFLSVNNQFSKLVTMGLTTGITYVDNLNSQPADAFKYSTYGSANIFFYLNSIVNLGLEYSFGKRVNKNNQYGTANRISFRTIIDL